MAGETVLVVDHEHDRRHHLIELLKARQFDVLDAASSDDASALVQAHCPPVIICETDLPNRSGLFLLKEAKELQPDIEFILLTHDTSSYSLLQALRLGAYDCIVRPIDDGEILFNSLDRALVQIGLKRQNQRLIGELEKRNRSLKTHLAMMKALHQSVEQLMRVAGTQELLSTLLDSAVTEIHADRGFIALYDKEDNLGIKISRGIDPAISRFFARQLPSGVITLAAQQNKPALVPDEMPAEWLQRASKEELENLQITTGGLLMAPLNMADKRAGVIAVLGHPHDTPFGERDLLFLIQLAHHASLALERESRLYQEKKNGH